MRDLAPTPAAANDAMARRIRVVDSAIELFRTRHLSTVGIEDVAATASLTIDEVNEQFASWEDIVLAATDRWHGRRMRHCAPLLASRGTVRFLRAVMESNIDDPALGRFLLAAADWSRATEHPLSVGLNRRWHEYQTTVQNGLTHDISVGREPSTMAPCRGAEQLIALTLGLQVQAMMRPGMDLLAAFDRAVVRLREGWSRSYIPPVWELDDDY